MFLHRTHKSYQCSFPRSLADKEASRSHGVNQDPHIGPFSHTLAAQLRCAGFAGEIWALVQRPILATSQGQTAFGYERVITADWLSAMNGDQQLLSAGGSGSV